MSSKVGVLAFTGGVVLVVSLLLAVLQILFMCSPSFDAYSYGVRGILEAFAVLAAGAAFGFLLLMWAKRCEGNDENARAESFLRDMEAIEGTRRFKGGVEE
jgi:hypothetical protein